MKKIIILLIIVTPILGKAQIQVTVTGEDTLCFGEGSLYSASIENRPNQ